MLIKKCPFSCFYCKQILGLYITLLCWGHCHQCHQFLPPKPWERVPPRQAARAKGGSLSIPSSVVQLVAGSLVQGKELWPQGLTTVLPCLDLGFAQVPALSEPWFLWLQTEGDKSSHL